MYELLEKKANPTHYFKQNMYSRNSYATNKENVIQKVKDLSPAGGRCGPAVLLPIFKESPLNSALNAEDIKSWLISDGHHEGGIFTRKTMEDVSNHYGANIDFKNFDNAEELGEQLAATGEKPVLLAVSNVKFPGKERAGDDKLETDVEQWKRAHWVLISHYDSVNKELTYKDNGGTSQKVSLDEAFRANNQMANQTWDWQKAGFTLPTRQSNGKEGASTELIDITGAIAVFN